MKNKRNLLAAALITGLWLAAPAANAATLTYPLPARPVVAADTVLNTPGKPAVVKPGDFSIAIIPDTQYYLAQAQLGGNFDMFKAQIEWIKKN